MKIDTFENIYFVGIGGIGMSAIARYFKAQGKAVAGYDRTQTAITDALMEEGISITFKDGVENIPESHRNPNTTLVVYTPAIPADHQQLNYFKGKDFPFYKRSQVLGLISDHLQGIGIAGTHGKTTVSTLTAHILKQSSLDCNAFLGGISRNYESNLLLSQDSPWVVLEADEFDRSFLQLHPQVAVVTSMDADHLDIYGEKAELERTFHQYVSQIRPGGKLVYKKGLPFERSGIDFYSYALEEEADFYAHNLRLEEGFYLFDLKTPMGVLNDLKLSYPGKVNVENAVAASAVALLCGVTEDELRAALSVFKGVWRRFDYQVRTENLVFIDDYAHHPRELSATISSVRDLYPNRKLTGIFQPHLYTRTRDFVDGFAESLSLLDEVILLDIYPARELPIEGITSKIIMDRVTVPCQLCKKEELFEVLQKKEIEVLLTLGAGDIDKLVAPIKKQLLERIGC